MTQFLHVHSDLGYIYIAVGIGLQRVAGRLARWFAANSKQKVNLEFSVNMSA